ncbi:MAG: InlB B-repeat-containing protein, partial [Muribaculaceae bacterium]|nr:InlB B-repeat-containing protein [Muribaculaceae bacterium]
MMKRYFLSAFIAATVAAIFIFSGCAAFAQGTNTPTTYSVTYMDGNEVLFTKQVEENSYADNVVLQEKQGYDFVCWRLNGKAYNFQTPVTRNLILSAHWSLESYTVTFIADGITVDTRTYTQTDDTVTEPAVPDKFGYTAEWGSYTLNNGNITVYAVYTPIPYEISFYADGKVIYTSLYTLDNPIITEPAVPNKQGMTGSWSEYSLTGGDISVYAVYENINYTVTFIADGVTVGTCSYDATDRTVTPPTVPYKEGYTGEWEAYTLDCEDITVNAIYTPIPNEFTDGLGIRYDLIDNAYTITGYTGNSTFLEIPAFIYGLPVVSIANYAFYGSVTLQEVIISDTIEVLGLLSFGGCTN